MPSGNQVWSFCLGKECGVRADLCPLRSWGDQDLESSRIECCCKNWVYLMGRQGWHWCNWITNFHWKLGLTIPHLSTKRDQSLVFQKGKFLYLSEPHLIIPFSYNWNSSQLIHSFELGTALIRSWTVSPGCGIPAWKSLSAFVWLLPTCRAMCGAHLHCSYPWWPQE